ncbi:MAG: hypothetical protein AAGC64_04390 [Bacteroidota bacterium]
MQAMDLLDVCFGWAKADAQGRLIFEYNHLNLPDTCGMGEWAGAGNAV